MYKIEGEFRVGASCTVAVAFQPTLSGTRYGAVVLDDRSGNVIATSYIQGTGIGPQVNFFPGTQSTVTTSAPFPASLAVDGSGNIYVADMYNGRILRETPSSISYIESVVPTSTLSYPDGVAVDGAGNLYISDSGNLRVLKETLSNGSYVESVVPTVGLGSPAGLAVDGSGNVYIADSIGSQIVMETLSSGTYTQSTIPTSQLAGSTSVAVDGNGDVYISTSSLLVETFSSGGYTESVLPDSVGAAPLAIDSNGDVYVADYSNNRILKETPAGGSYIESTIAAGNQMAPRALAVDGNGNLYIADGNGSVLKQDTADPPSLSFAVTAPDTTSSDSPQTIMVTNDGNARLSVVVPTSGENPNITSNFTLNGSAVNACPVLNSTSSSAATLASHQSCMLPISFLPSGIGQYSGTLAIMDNTLNAIGPGYATQTILLSGTGTGNTQQTITFGSITAQPVNSTVALSASSSSGLPVVFTSSTPASCTVSGTIASLIAGGTCSIQASQPGNTTYAAANPVVQSFTVNLLPQSAPDFPPIPNQIINTTVPFGVNVYGSAILTSTTPAVCTMSGTFTASLIGFGTCTLQAYYAGDGVVYAQSPTVTQSFVVQSFNPLAGTSFGTVNVGSTSPTSAVTLTVNAAGTVEGISVVTGGISGLDFSNAGGGTCAVAVAYSVGDTCTVNVSFAPTLDGTRSGAVTLVDGSGDVLASGYLLGTGVAPRVNFLSGTESAVPTSTLMNFPYGAAVDAGGAVYIADTGNNRILKETPSSTGYTESVVPTSSLYRPYGIAVDGSGSLYIADTYNSRVLKETLGTSGYIESTVYTVNHFVILSVAVDGSGNVYVWDPYNSDLVMLSPYSGGYLKTVLPTSFIYGDVTGLAVDGSGNIYLADTENERILKETLSSGTYTETTVPTSVAGPFGIAVDGQGDIYISDENGSTGAMRILKETPSEGIYVESVLQTSRLNIPFGIATDNRGNVYVADSGNNRILKEDFADSPSVSFSSTAVGTTSSDSPQVVTIQNVGNATLNFAVPTSGTNPSMTGNFILGSDQESLCPVVSAGSSASGTLIAGHSCALPISFAPTGTGTISGSMTLTDNVLNAAGPGYAIQSIALSGVGTGSAYQTISFSALPNVTYGVGPIALAATSSSGLPVTYTVSGPATVLGSTMTITGAGSVTVTAWQPGNESYAAAASVSQSFTVYKAALTITASTVSVVYNQPIPALTGYTIAGFVNGDTQSVLSGSPTESTTASQGSAAGTYPISITEGTLAAASYSFGFASGTLTITNGPPAISFVQVASDTPQTPTATLNVNYPSAQTAGDLNVVVVGWQDASSSVQSVTDSAGNFYHLAIGPTVGAGVQQSIYYASDIISGANTVTVTFSQAASYPDIRILEYQGLTAVDAVAGASGNSASAFSGVAMTSSPSDLIFGADTAATQTLGAGSGFTARIVTSPNSDMAEDETMSATGSYSAGATLATAAPWAMQMVAFSASPPGAVSVQFNGVENPLSENGMWSTTGSWSSLSENDGVYSTTISGAARLVAPAAGSDQFAQITYDQDPGTQSWVGVMTRVQSATNGSCYLAIAYAGQVRLYRTDDNGSLSFPSLASVNVDVSVAPRLLRLESRGSTHQVYFNGVLLITYTDPNNMYATGQPGIAASVSGGGPTVKILTFMGGALGDTLPPVLTQGQPAGALPSGTTSTTLSLTTNEVARCRYATSAGVPYGSMTNSFGTTGGTSQSTVVTGLQDGGAYTYYVRCQDTAGNIDASDYPIAFSIVTSSGTVSIQFSGVESPLSEDGTWSTTGSWSSLSNNNGVYTTTDGAAARLATPAVGPDQFAEITYDQDPGTQTWVGVMTRVQSASNGSGYLAIAYSGQVRLYRVDDTGSLSFPQLASANVDVSVAPRLLRLESQGSTHRVYFNGVLMIAYADPNSVYTSGQPGIAEAVFGGPTVKILTVTAGALGSGSGNSPVLTGAQPMGTLPSGTTSTTLSLTTNEAATCRYATSAGVAFGSMTNTFSTTGGTSQSTVITGLQDGGVYAYYVRCQDGAGDVDTDDYVITFSIVTSGGTVSSHFVGLETPLSDGGMWSTMGSWSSLWNDNGAYSMTINSAARLATPAVGPDQFAEITYDQDPGTDSWVGVMTRAQSASNGSGYLAIAYSGQVRLYRTDDNGSLSFPLLASANVDVSVAPRLLRLESQGSTHRVYFNGTLSITYTDPNNVYASGQPGIAAAVFGGPTVRILSFTGGTLGDTTPPVLTLGQPSGALPSGTTSATLSLTTSEAATCRYATSAGVAFGSMTNTFGTTGGISQSTVVSGLQDGGAYTYYVRCQDSAGNADTDDYPITFSIASSSGMIPPLIKSGSPPFTATIFDGRSAETVTFYDDGAMSWARTVAEVSANSTHDISAITFHRSMGRLAFPSNHNGVFPSSIVQAVN